MFEHGKYEVKNSKQKKELEIPNSDAHINSTEPARSSKEKIVDYIFDMFAMPDQIELSKVNNGNDGFRQDAENIRGYFLKALHKLPLKDG
ncbi:MAG: hypothetical protein OXH65_00580 [Paracoccaceae bacterium]|nr:hypothetical protein [Paracoccaceae bacterium]MDE2673587.1 hypothetical protein [Paracoccaceae bacterium]